MEGCGDRGLKYHSCGQRFKPLLELQKSSRNADVVWCHKFECLRETEVLFQQKYNPEKNKKIYLSTLDVSRKRAVDQLAKRGHSTPLAVVAPGGVLPLQDVAILALVEPHTAVFGRWNL